MKGLSIAFAGRTILKDVSWTIGDRGRIALVGDNGAGKTTFLKLLAGVMEPDDGTIASSASIGYLPQDLVELGSGTVLEHMRDRAGIAEIARSLEEHDGMISGASDRELDALLAARERLWDRYEALGGIDFDHTARKILRGLGFAPGDADRACADFSGGWRMRIALAAVLISRPEIMLLDEPTNHLDSEAMEWLEGRLRDHAGLIIFVSHDRRFLDKMSTEVAELARGSITRYAMSYEQFVSEREVRREQRERALMQQHEEIEHMQRFVDRFRYKASKASQVQSRLKRLERMELLEGESAARSVTIRFPEAERSGREVLTARGIAKSYGETHVLSSVDVDIERGERIALVGVNGAGKSTLMRVLAGVDAPDEGSVRLGHAVKMSFYSQESAQDLNYSHTIWEEARRFGSDITEARKRDLLGAFLFSGDDIHKSVRVLSGGEKSRLALFRLLLSDSNLLMLDEPTNHLDMTTRGIFQRALLDYGGTLLIVSHDRFFLDSIATRVIEVRDGAVRSFAGGWSRFIEAREAEQLNETASGASAQSAAPRGRRDDRRAEAERRAEISNVKKRYSARIEALEQRIDSAERRRAEIDAMLCSAEAPTGAAVGELMIERSSLESALEADMAEWERLNEQMDEEVRSVSDAQSSSPLGRSSKRP